MDQSAIMDQVADTVTSATSNEFHCANGVILRLNPVKSSLVRKSWQHLERPSVPRFFIEDKQRWEENPNDPDYKQAVKEFQADRAEIVANTYYMLGTVAKFIPENISPVDSKDWEEILEIINEKVPAKPLARYLYWLKYYVLDDDESLELMKSVMRFSGVVLSEDVDEAEESFRDN